MRNLPGLGLRNTWSCISDPWPGMVIPCSQIANQTSRAACAKVDGSKPDLLPDSIFSGTRLKMRCAGSNTCTQCGTALPSTASRELVLRKKRLGEGRGFPASVPPCRIGSQTRYPVSYMIPQFAVRLPEPQCHHNLQLDPAQLVRDPWGRPPAGVNPCRGRISQLSRKCRFPIEFAASISSYMVARGERLRLAALPSREAILVRFDNIQASYAYIIVAGIAAPIYIEQREDVKRRRASSSHSSLAKKLSHMALS
jgi:hypothetical protein